MLPVMLTTLGLALANPLVDLDLNTADIGLQPLEQLDLSHDGLLAIFERRILPGRSILSRSPRRHNVAWRSHSFLLRKVGGLWGGSSGASPTSEEHVYRRCSLLKFMSGHVSMAAVPYARAATCDCVCLFGYYCLLYLFIVIVIVCLFICFSCLFVCLFVFVLAVALTWFAGAGCSRLFSCCFIYLFVFFFWVVFIYWVAVV